MALTNPDRGWAWVVLIGSFMSHTIHGYFGYSIGLIHVALLNQFEKSVGETSLTSSIFIALFSVSGPISGAIVNRCSCRVSMCIGASLMTAGFLVTAFAPNLYLTVVSTGIVSGIGAGLCYHASYVAIGFNFHKKRNLATGIAVSGCGFGIFVLTPIMQIVYDTYGYTGFFIMCAGISLHHFLFGTLFLPCRLRMAQKELARQQRRNTSSIRNSRCKLLQMCRFFQNKAFNWLCVSLVCSHFGIYLMYLHFPKSAIESGSSASNVAYMLSVSGLINAFSRALIGCASNSDNMNELLLYTGSYFVLGISASLYPLYGSSSVGKFAFVISLGLYSGCCYSLLNSLTMKIIGLKDYTSAYAMELFSGGIGCILGPPLAGVIVDSGGTYSHSFAVAGCALILGGVSGCLVVLFKEGKSTVYDISPGTDVNVEEYDKGTLASVDDQQNTLGFGSVSTVSSLFPMGDIHSDATDKIPNQDFVL